MTLNWLNPYPVSYDPLDLVIFDLSNVNMDTCTQAFVHAGEYRLHWIVYPVKYCEYIP